MNQPPQIEKIPAEIANPVASFQAGVITSKGDAIGVCLKFSMYDRTERVTYWHADEFADLMVSLKSYAEHLGHNAFMIRAFLDPNLVQDLDPRHPYHTLTTEVPSLNEDEIGRASLTTGVITAAFVIRGPTFEAKIKFADGGHEKISFHEYTALSMYAYLDEYIKAFDQLYGPPGGNA